MNILYCIIIIISIAVVIALILFAGKKCCDIAIKPEIAEKYCDRIIVTEDNSRTEETSDIIKDIISGFRGSSYGIISSRDQAIKFAITSSEDGDIVVIAGKGHERYMIDKSGYRYFNEKEIILKALTSEDKNEIKA